MARTSIPVGRLAAEGFAILLSILLAFGIDAWWDGRLEAEREQEILADLNAEFERNQELLTTMEEGHASRAASALRLLRAARGEATRPPTDSVPVLLFNALSLEAGSYDPREGVLTSIVASGEIRLISDDSLRYALAEWPRALQDATEDEQWIIREVQNSIQPHLFGLVAMDEVFGRHLPQLDLTYSRGVDYFGALEDVRLRNLLLAQIFNEQFVVAELRELDIVMSDILRLIDRNLEQ